MNRDQMVELKDAALAVSPSGGFGDNLRALLRGRFHRRNSGRHHERAD